MKGYPPPGAGDLLELLEEVELLLRRGNARQVAVRAYARFVAEEIAAFRLSLSDSPERYDESREVPGAQRPPGARHFPAALEHLEATDVAAHLTRQLERLGERLPWSSFYGSDLWTRPFLDEIAALKLLGPGSPVPSSRTAAGIFLMGPELLYPLHAHAAEELYLVLAGAIAFRTRSEDPWSEKGPGEIVLHRSQEPHEMKSGPASLALYVWQGEIFEPSWYKSDIDSPDEPPKYPEM